MKKRFILLVDNTTADQNKAFRDFVEASGLNWWHWISNAWLLIDQKGTWKASQLRDKAKEVYPGENTFVAELRPDDDTWSGFGPSTEKRNMFKWIEQNWKK
jgi:hypothetical protein